MQTFKNIENLVCVYNRLEQDFINIIKINLLQSVAGITETSILMPKVVQPVLI